MIDLTWNTQGRIGRRAYNSATGGITLVQWAGLILGAIALFYFAHDNIYISLGTVAIVTAILLYLQYRYAQLAIKRLHDRGLPGWLYVPMLLSAVVTMGYGSWTLLKALINGGLFSFIGSLIGLIGPIVTILFYKGIGVTLIVLFACYLIFIAYNLGAEGYIGDNRYGADPHER